SIVPASTGVLAVALSAMAIRDSIMNGLGLGTEASDTETTRVTLRPRALAIAVAFSRAWLVASIKALVLVACSSLSVKRREPMSLDPALTAASMTLLIIAKS